MNAMQKMVKARSKLLESKHFFGHIALTKKLAEDTTCDTLWTDGISIGFNPDFVMECNFPRLIFIICHEVEHITSMHHLRQGNRDGELWNQAADYVINGYLKKDTDLVWQTDCLYDKRFDKMSAERVYSMLDAERKQNNKNNQNKPGNDKKGIGEVRPMPGANGIAAPQEIKEAKEKQIIDMIRAERQSKMIGELPGGVEELISNIKDCVVDWKEALNRFVELTSKSDYSWQKVNRRYIGTGFMLPSLQSEQLPPIHVWVDTSGSVRKSDLEAFGSEIDEIMTRYNTTIEVVYCDYKIQNHETFTSDNQPIQLDAKGGGGTRFSPAIKWSMEQDEHPCCGIYLTDMECSDFGDEPDFPVLWVQTMGHEVDVPFGEIIRMSLPI